LRNEFADGLRICHFGQDNLLRSPLQISNAIVVGIADWIVSGTGRGNAKGNVKGNVKELF